MIDRIIPDAPKVGIVIGTYGSVAYVHLQLETAQRHYPDLPILVRDDGSPQYMELNDLCMQYKVEFSTASVRSRQRPDGRLGDLAVFWHGLLWAKRQRLDLLVKISRRWIISENWVPGLVELAARTQYPTYTNECKHYRFGFRPEFIALHVRSWCCKEILSHMKERMEQGDLKLPEEYLHDMALIAHQRNRCSVNDAWEKEHGNQDRGGYGVWEALGQDRHAVPASVIWHDQHPPEVYLAKAQEYGLPYKRDQSHYNLDQR
jgi:hypothetical protein